LSNFRPDPANLSRYLDDIQVGDMKYTQSVNPFHVRDGDWAYRVLADRPMNSANYGAASPFKRKDTGGTHTVVHEAKFEGVGEVNTTLENMASPTSMTVNNSTGGGTTVILSQVADPGGSGRKVWQFQWDCTLLWGKPDSGTATSATDTGRRRGELRASTQNLIPYGTEVWAISSVYLDPAVNWAGMTAGDYVHTYQFHDTTYGTSHKPSLAGYICAPRSTRSGDFPDPPSRWFYLHELLDANENAIARYVQPDPPVGKWIYTVQNFRYGGSNPFMRVWHIEEGKPPVLAIDYTGPYGYPDDDLGTDYAKVGPYSPGTYTGTIPYRRYWFDGLVQLRASDVPGMTPERMVACLLADKGF
jgi:hypothetical protein